MKKTCQTSRKHTGFSLAEVIAALTISTAVLVVMIGIYSRAQQSAAAVISKLDSTKLPSEILQRIAEDLDGVLAAGGGNVKITIENKLENGFAKARLEILKIIYDIQDQPRVFEKIVWQAAYDYDSGAKGLVLYRSHSGIAMEDKLLDEQKDSWERELFVPVCTGVTYFNILIPVGESFQNKWTENALPSGIVVSVSFAEPFKALDGTFDVPDTAKITRTIAVDRTRKIRFIFVKKEFEDPNALKTEKETAESEETKAEETVEEPNNV